MSEKIKLEFYQPSAEFSPMPFWFWNDALDESEIIRQIHDYRSKGVMGFVIHPRVGIPDDLGYLDERFMGYVKLAVSEAARNEMKVILYDEGMYPSGSAHGEVVAGNPEFATGGLRMIEYSCSGVMEIHPPLQAGERVIATLAVEKSEACCIVPVVSGNYLIRERASTLKPLLPEDGRSYFWWRPLAAERFAASTSARMTASLGPRHPPICSIPRRSGNLSVLPMTVTMKCSGITSVPQ